MIPNRKMQVMIFIAVDDKIRDMLHSEETGNRKSLLCSLLFLCLLEEF